MSDRFRGELLSVSLREELLQGLLRGVELDEKRQSEQAEENRRVMQEVAYKGWTSPHRLRVDLRWPIELAEAVLRRLTFGGKLVECAEAAPDGTTKYIAKEV